MRYKLLRYIGIILSSLGSAIICFRAVLTEVLLNMDIGDWITIGGIVIGFLGVILGVTIPLRRDGKSIDETKAIASDIQPKVSGIHSSTEAMKTSIVKIEERNSKIDSIAMEIEVFKRLKSDISGNSVNPEILLAAISNVFEENAQLRKKNQESQIQILTLTNENFQLRTQVGQLEGKLKERSPDCEFEP